MQKKIGKICVITDTNVQNKYTHIELAQMAIKGGADMIQLRDKTIPSAALIETAIKIKKNCNKRNILFIVNDRVDIAMISGADGVHLGEDDIPVKDARKLIGKNKIIGKTAHSMKEALKTVKEGADYIGLGHIYHTYSKLRAPKPMGVRELEKICAAVRIPVIAIGGINFQNAAEVINHGAYGIAVIGSVIKSSSPVKAVKTLHEIIYG
jgi:thiamine-phosphate pyrophosphorylase